MIERVGSILVALYEPDIASNAGAILRTCACLGADAAVIEPAGFRMTDPRFRRAGMDYLKALRVFTFESWSRFDDWRKAERRRLVLLTTKGDSVLWNFAFLDGDIILLGRESTGAPDSVHAAANACVRIPIRTPLRSLNVGVAAAIAAAEALRQLDRLPED